MLRPAAFNKETRIITESGREYVIPARSEVKGTGGFAEVRVARDVARGVDVAAKIIQLRPVGKTDEKTVQREVRIMRQASSVPHENVLRVLDVAIAKGDSADLTHASPLGPAGTAYVFLELCSGGELFDRLTDFGTVPEAYTAEYMRGLLTGVRHLHSRGVIHRDIKLENVLLTSDWVVKLADFGLAAELAVDASGAPINVNALLRDVVGSQSYVAPEVLARKRGGYTGPPADVWSCGVCLFTLLSGFFPLDVADARDWRFRRLAGEQARGNLRTCEFIFALYQRPCPFSREVQDFLDGLLRIDPAMRFTVDEALEHSWLCMEHADLAEADDADDEDTRVTYRTHTAAAPAPVSLVEGMPVALRQRAHNASVLGTGGASSHAQGLAASIATGAARRWVGLALIGAGIAMTLTSISRGRR